MPNRTTDLLNIRPEIHDAIVFETMSDDERFQNTTIRPVIKLQHDLLIEVFKNHKLIKIFQQETSETSKIENFVNNLKEKSKKIATIFVRATPIMETLTGIMIAILIYVSGKLILNNELEVNNFFSFLAAMMLAYQPVRSLATLHMGISLSLIHI